MSNWNSKNYGLVTDRGFLKIPRNFAHTMFHCTSSCACGRSRLSHSDRKVCTTPPTPQGARSPQGWPRKQGGKISTQGAKARDQTPTYLPRGWGRDYVAVATYFNVPYVAMLLIQAYQALVQKRNVSDSQLRARPPIAQCRTSVT